MSKDDIIDADFEEITDAFKASSDVITTEDQRKDVADDRQLVIEFALTEEQQKALKNQNEGPGYYDVRLVDPSAKMHQLTAEFAFFNPSTKVTKDQWIQEFRMDNGKLFQLVIMGADLGRPGDQEQELIHWLMSQIAAAKQLKHAHLDKHIRFRVADFLEYMHKKKKPGKTLPKAWSGRNYDSVYQSVFRLKAATYFSSVNIEQSFRELSHGEKQHEKARGTNKSTTALVVEDVISFAKNPKQKINMWSWLDNVHTAEDGIIHLTLSDVAWSIFDNETAHLQEDSYIFQINSAIYRAIARYMERHLGNNQDNFLYAIKEENALERYGLSSVTKAAAAMDRSRIKKLNTLQPFIGSGDNSGFAFFCCSDPHSRETKPTTYHFAMRADDTVRKEWVNAAETGDIPIDIKGWFATYSNSDASHEAFLLAAKQRAEDTDQSAEE